LLGLDLSLNGTVSDSLIFLLLESSSTRGDQMHAHSHDISEKVSTYREVMRSQGFSTSAIYQRTRLLNALGVSPDEATREHVLSVLGNAGKASTRRVYLNALRSAFRDMLGLGMVDHDPTAGLRTPAPARSRPHPLTQNEVDLLLTIEGRARSWTILGLRAGLRAKEVVAVKPEHLEWTDSGYVLRIPNGKGGLNATVPAHPDVVAMLEPLRDYHDRLWPINANTMSQAWRQAAESVGVHGKRFHDCRHTFASTIYSHTGDLLVTRDLLRHASVQTTQVYAASDDDRAFSAVSGL